MDSRDLLILAGLGGLVFWFWRRSKAAPQSAADAPTTIDSAMTPTAARVTQLGGHAFTRGLVVTGGSSTSPGETPFALTRPGDVFKTSFIKALVADTAPAPQSPVPNTFFTTTAGVTEPAGTRPPPTLGTNPVRGVFG